LILPHSRLVKLATACCVCRRFLPLLLPLLLLLLLLLLLSSPTMPAEITIDSCGAHKF